MNQIYLVGHLGHAASSRQGFVTFNLATSETFKDKNTGESKTLTEWHSCAVSVPYLQDTASKLLAGDKVFVSGKMHYVKKQDPDGKTKTYANVIVMRLEIIEKHIRSDVQRPQTLPQVSASKSIFDDDLPF